MDNVNRFKRYGSIANRRPTGRPTTIPDNVVRHCSVALKQGYMVTTYLAGQPPQAVLAHRYYTTIKQVCTANVLLAEVCRQYGVSPSHLLRRMHQVDPMLSHHTLHYKQELTMQQMLKRLLVAAQLWQSCTNNTMQLLFTFWADECSILFVSPHASLKVYCDAHDQNVSLVLPCKHLKKGQQ